VYKRQPIPLALDKLRNLPVLIVDDNFTNRRVLHGMLSRWAVSYTHLANALKANQILLRQTGGVPPPLTNGSVVLRG